MGTESENLERRDPASLSHLLDTDPPLGEAWSADDIGAILRHQLSLSIHADLSAHALPLDPSPALRGLLLKSYDDVIRDPAPSLELLHLVSRNAKRRRADANNLLPREVLAALYYASIAAARFRLGQRITSLSDEALLKGLQWMLAQPWIDGALRELFLRGVDALRANTTNTLTGDATTQGPSADAGSDHQEIPSDE